MTAKLSISEFQIKQPVSAHNERAKFQLWSEQLSDLIASNINKASVDLRPIFIKAVSLYNEGLTPQQAYAKIESEFSNLQ